MDSEQTPIDWSEILTTIISSLCRNTPVTPQQMQVGVDFARKLIPDTQTNYMTMAQDIINHNFDSAPVYNIVFAQRWNSGVLINVPCPLEITELVQNISKQLTNVAAPYLPAIMEHLLPLYQLGQMTELRENYDSSNYRLSCSLHTDDMIVTCLWIMRISSNSNISISLPIPDGPNMELNLSTAGQN